MTFAIWGLSKGKKGNFTMTIYQGEGKGAAREIKQNQVFVKAKTGEKLGDVGQSRAVEVWVTCLLSK